MLTRKKVRCVYCSQSLYFYVYVAEYKGKVAIYNECPHCHTFMDVYCVTKAKLDTFLAKVLDGLDPGN